MSSCCPRCGFNKSASNAPALKYHHRHHHLNIAAMSWRYRAPCIVLQAACIGVELCSTRPQRPQAQQAARQVSPSCLRACQPRAERPPSCRSIGRRMTWMMNLPGTGALLPDPCDCLTSAPTSRAVAPLGVDAQGGGRPAEGYTLLREQRDKSPSGRSRASFGF